EDRFADDSRRQRRRAAPGPRRHAVPPARLVARHPPARALHLRAGERPAGQLPAQTGQAGLRRVHHGRGEDRRRRHRDGQGRSLRRGRAHRRAERPGVDLVPPAPAAHRLQPGGATRRHDGDGGPRLAGRRRQAARGPRGQAVLRRGRRAVAVKAGWIMVKRTLMLLLVTLAGVDRSSAATARSLYADALGREHTVRAALSADHAEAGLLKDVRALVAAYEAIVRKYPASGYSDNALWQGARLSLDAFARFGQEQDQARGIRLLRALAAQYPTSKLARRVDETLASTSPGTTSQPARITTIRDISRAVLADAVRVTIELDAEVPFHDERLSDPVRVFLDLPQTRAAA